MLFARALVALVALAVASEAKKPPSLAFILIDDLGFNDFSFRSSDLKPVWPNVNALVNESIVVDTYYTQPICTPTRGAFMSGRWPARLGLQHGVITGFQDYGLPLDEVTLADKMKSAGYKTYATGKWHLGAYSFDATPTKRGFDHYLGYYNGMEDYLTHEIQGYLDLHRQNATSFEQVTDASGTFSTNLFGADVVASIHAHVKAFPDTPGFFYMPLQNVHSPLESPGASYDAACLAAKIVNPDRRTFCAMAAIADEAIGNVTKAMAAAFKGEDYLVVIAGDNGGIPMAAGNNFPLRGHKAELFEGGIRNNAVFWGSLVPEERRGTTYSKGLVHVVDVHATFAALATASSSSSALDATTGKKLDGVNVWGSLVGNTASPRSEFLINYDPCSGHGACSGTEMGYRDGDMKLLLGVASDTWYPVPTDTGDDDDEVLDLWQTTGVVQGPSGGVWWRDEEHYSTADANSTTWLFNVTADPTEHTNLASLPEYADLIKTMRGKIMAIVQGDDYKAPCNVPPSGSCYTDDAKGAVAAKANNGWYPWL